MKKGNIGEKVKKKKTISLSTLFTLLIVFVVVFSITLSSVLTTVQSSRSIRDTAKISTEQTIKQVAGNLDGYFKEINDTLKQAKEYQTVPSSLTNYLKAVIYARKDILVSIIYDENGNIKEKFDTFNPITPVNPETNLSFNKEEFAKLKYNNIFISEPHVQNMIKNEYPWVVTFAIRLEDDLTTPANIITFDVSFDWIANMINSIGLGQNGYAYIVDDDFNIMYHPKQTMINAGIEQEIKLNNKFINNTLIEDEMVYSSRSLYNIDWNVIGKSSLKGIKTNQMVNAIINISITTVLSIVLGILGLLLFRKFLSMPINNLIREINAFEKNFDKFEVDKNITVEEFRDLSNSFSEMAFNLQRYIAKIEQDKNVLMKTELKALQWQINPHFLYNTLDSITWMCEHGKTEDAVKMLSALARLFRISISRGKELISVSKEVEHAECYLIIQSYRYKKAFDYTFEVEDKVKNYLCNKITIQPFLENALIHGMSPVDEMHIDIKIFEQDEKLVIQVIDDGVGMSEEQVQKLLFDSESDNKGIGVNNVNKRIKINFGEEYGVKIDSEMDEGTTVTIYLPIIKDDEEK